MTSPPTYIKATCPHCDTEQPVNVAELCRKNEPFVLGDEKSRLKAPCINPDCSKGQFIVKVDCKEYRS